jgi:hypothetical protein
LFLKSEKVDAVISMNANSGQELVRLRRKSLNRRCNTLRDEVPLSLSISLFLLDSLPQLDSFRVLLGDIAMAPDSLPESDEQTDNEPEEIEPIPALNIIEPGAPYLTIQLTRSAAHQIGPR